MRLAKENRDNEVFLFSPCLYLLGKMQAVFTLCEVGFDGRGVN